MKAATLGHVPREQRVGRASMKGRPIKSGDTARRQASAAPPYLDEGPPDQEQRLLGDGAGGDRVVASMKGRPITSGDVVTQYTFRVPGGMPR